MNGIQFYLRTDRPLADDHDLSRPTGRSSISQRQFWRGYDLSSYGDRRVGGILSVIHLELVGGGQFQRAASDVSVAQAIKDEVWAQLKAANAAGDVRLADDNLVGWFLDPDIQLPNPGHHECRAAAHQSRRIAGRGEAYTGRQLFSPPTCEHTNLPRWKAPTRRPGGRRMRSLPCRGRSAAVRFVGVRRSLAMQGAQVWTTCASGWDFESVSRARVTGARPPGKHENE
jgi:hypothetical protein